MPLYAPVAKQLPAILQIIVDSLGSNSGSVESLWSLEDVSLTPTVLRPIAETPY